MSVPIESALPAQLRATRVAFFIPGFVIAAWAPAIPFVKTRAALDEAGLGLLLLCLGAGSLLAMPLAGVVAARHGCRVVMLVSSLLACAMLAVLAQAAAPALLAAALFLFGAGLGAMDCAMNLQAVRVERDSGRALMSGFHAFYSVGGLVGAAGATAALAAGLPPAPALSLVAGIALALLLPAAPHWRPERVPPTAAVFAWPHGKVLLIGALCFATFLVEGAMLDWSAVFQHEVHGIDPRRAGLPYVAFALAMTVARLLGDAWVQRLGRRRAILGGGLVAGAGLLTATFATAPMPALCGYAPVGIGCANIVPALFSLAGAQRAMPESQAIPAITTLGYAGVLAGPALVGFVADATHLAVAFVVLSALLFAVAASVRLLADVRSAG